MTWTAGKPSFLLFAVSVPFQVLVALVAFLAPALPVVPAVLALTAAGAVTPALAGDDDDDRPRRRGVTRRSMPRAMPLVRRPAMRGAPQRAVSPRQQRRSPVEFVALVPQGQATAPLDAAGFLLVARASLPAIGDDVIRVRSTRRESANSALQRLRSTLPGRPVDLNVLYRPSRLSCSTADCPKFSMVGWPLPPSTCGIETTIGMIDTAVQVSHAALRAGTVEAITVRAPDREPSSDRHGTGIAALLVGQAHSAHPGLLPRARLVAVDVFHRAPDGQDKADSFDLVRGLDALAGRGIRVANLSLSGADSTVLREAVARTLAKGMVIVAAAGNQGPRARPIYPGAYAGVIAVTAIDRNGRLFRQANRGDHIAFAAPGVNLVLADTRGRSRPQSGTSLAVPFVTAAAAVAMQSGRPGGPPLLDVLRSAAADLGRPGYDREFGWGLIRLPARCP